jgi:hypothetical protein
MARAIPVTTDAATLNRRGKLLGWSLRETAGAVATVDLYDHATAASGTRVAAISLAAAGSSTVVYPEAVQLANGLYYDVTGDVAGSVYVQE